MRLLDERRDNNAVISDKISELISGKFGIPMTEVVLPIAIAVEAADAVMKMAFRNSPLGDPAILGEARALVRGYLSSRLPA